MSRSEGARVTVQRLYGSPAKWAVLLREVSSGKPRWLSTAVILYKAADAGAASMLAASLSEALENKATTMLRLAETGELGVSVFCIGPDIDDDRYREYSTASQALERRISTVSAVSESSLEVHRAACLRVLLRQRVHLATFFGRPVP